MRNDKKLGTIVILFLIIGIFSIYAYQNGLMFKQLAITDSKTFTPIFCNDYEFTCCNEQVDSVSTYTITDESAWKCPSWASKCEILSVSVNNVAVGYEKWAVGSKDCEVAGFPCKGFRCSDERFQEKQMQPNEFVWLDHPCLNSQGKIEVKVYKKRLDFCGKAGCKSGVPVLGADQCTFTPENAKIYTTTNQLINAISYTVPLGECVLAFQSGNRHICGYIEESCQDDSDCGGHTYGRFECYGRTLQEYGCRSFGIQNPELEKDRLPSDAGFGTDDNSVVSGKRCEVIRTKQVQCCGDNDCGTNYFCDRNTWTCKRKVECREDADCGVSVQCDWATKTLKTPVCRNGICEFSEIPVECCSDVNCPSGYYCTEDRKCKERVATCTECPYECCVGECTIQGGFFDRLCPPEKPYCVDNVCLVEPKPETYCKNCDAFAISYILGSVWKEKSCKPKLLQNPTLCFLSFIKLALIPIVFIFSLLFGKQLFSELEATKKNEALQWVIGIIIAGILAYLTFVLFWVGLITFIIYIIIRIILKVT